MQSGKAIIAVKGMGIYYGKKIYSSYSKTYKIKIK